MGKTDGSRVLLLCLIFGLHHEEEAAGLGDEDEDFYLDVCHNICGIHPKYLRNEYL